MSDIRTLTSRHADQARTDFAAIESDLEVIQKQLARLPTRRELAGCVPTSLAQEVGAALGAQTQRPV